MVHTHNPSVLLKTDCICYLCSSSSTRSSLHVLCHTLLLTGNHVFSWHNFQELSYSPGKETVMLPPTATPSCVLVYLPVTLFWVCLCSSASANMVLCATCSSEDSFLALWLASPLLFQMRLEVLALGFLKTVSGFERKWFGVFKSSCVPSSQLDSQISLSRDYRCHVNVFISDVFSQCPRGLNLLLSTLWSRSYWHLLEGEETLDRYRLVLNCFSVCDICSTTVNKEGVIEGGVLVFINIAYLGYGWSYHGHF